MKWYSALLILSCTPIQVHAMMTKLWGMKSFIATVQPAKDNLVAVTSAELARVTPSKGDPQALLAATNKILQASIPIIEETGNFAQSKALKELTDNLKQLHNFITNCTTDSAA